jgi:hypothetical protein
MTKLNVKNLDHLGIIAAIVDELGLVDYINEQLGYIPDKVVHRIWGKMEKN